MNRNLLLCQNICCSVSSIGFIFVNIQWFHLYRKVGQPTWFRNETYWFLLPRVPSGTLLMNGNCIDKHQSLGQWLFVKMAYTCWPKQFHPWVTSKLTGGYDLVPVIYLLLVCDQMHSIVFTTIWSSTSDLPSSVFCFANANLQDKEFIQSLNSSPF